MKSTLTLISTLLLFVMPGHSSGLKSNIKEVNSNADSNSKDIRPNIVLIMADDMGYEAIGANGCQEYSTPNIDRIASSGVHFTQCISQPLCTPSRVKIMTGKHNYRNYEYFGYLNEKEMTFGHVMQSAGYKTCIVGKWQLNGLAFNLPGNDDKSRPHKMGFDEFALWQVASSKNRGKRFAEPTVNINGDIKKFSIDEYGPDIFCNYAIDFIDKNSDSPFFVYYPMVLVHDPFVPTPDSPEWRDKTLRHKQDTAFFADMVNYTDKIVGRIESALKKSGVYDNTILIFTADNGSHVTLETKTTDRVVKGAKGNTITDGTHVPMVVSWPNGVDDATVYEELISFADFMPTFAEIANRKIESDGRSFLWILKGERGSGNSEVLVDYDPRWGENVNKHRDRFVQTTEYKLYQDGKFYNIESDILEERPLDIDKITSTERRVYRQLQKRLDTAPSWDIDGVARPSALER